MPSILYKECIESLQPHVKVLPQAETDAIFEQFEARVPIYAGGSKIDWDRIEHKVLLDHPDQIMQTLEILLQKPVDPQVYVMWNNAAFSVLKTDIPTVVHHFNDVVTVWFEAWLYNPQQGYVMECYNSWEVIIGFL